MKLWNVVFYLKIWIYIYLILNCRVHALIIIFWARRQTIFEDMFIELLAIVGMICFDEFDLLEFIFLEIEAGVEVVIIEMEYFFECLKR